MSCDCLKRVIHGAAGLARAAATLGRSDAAALAESRLRICKTSPHRRRFTCGLCGCLLAAKARLPDETCDAGRWPATRP